MQIILVSFICIYFCIFLFIIVNMKIISLENDKWQLTKQGILKILALRKNLFVFEKKKKKTNYNSNLQTLILTYNLFYHFCFYGLTFV